MEVQNSDNHIYPNQLFDHMNQLLDHLNQLLEQLLDHLNQLFDNLNQLLDNLNQFLDHLNQLLNHLDHLNYLNHMPQSHQQVLLHPCRHKFTHSLEIDQASDTNRHKMKNHLKKFNKTQNKKHGLHFNAENKETQMSMSIHQQVEDKHKLKKDNKKLNKITEGTIC